MVNEIGRKVMYFRSETCIINTKSPVGRANLGLELERFTS